MIDIAIQAGFGSLRRFNAVFAEVYHRPPSAIRRSRTKPAVLRAQRRPENRPAPVDLGPLAGQGAV
jgi:AraC-like DNA-binding protein